MAEVPAPQIAADHQRLQAASDMPALVRAHHAVVYRYAARLCGCPVEAEDLTQQTFLIAQERLRQLRAAERARSWLLAIVRNLFLKGRRGPRLASVADMDIDMAAAASAASAEAIDGEALHVALRQLPDEFRVVLLMFYFEELSYRQIAEQLDVPLGTVMSRLSRAKCHLRTLLARSLDESHRLSVRHHSAAAARTTRSITMRAAP
jgi:RNA polymerase sigma-70 factor (ECF subfamily)